MMPNYKKLQVNILSLQSKIIISHIIFPNDSPHKSNDKCMHLYFYSFCKIVNNLMPLYGTYNNNFAFKGNGHFK